MQIPVFQPRGFHPPVSNTERQRQFRQRNPGYYQRLHAKRRAALKARIEAQTLADATAAAEPIKFTIPAHLLRPALPACYVPAMKVNRLKKDSITASLLKDVVECDQANRKATCDNVSVGRKPLDPPALYEDAGEGYNPDYTHPQQ